jgi:hypothetical protein
MFKHSLEFKLHGYNGTSLISIYLFIYFFYQQSGDAKKPYLAQYSVVVEDSPVSIS